MGLAHGKPLQHSQQTNHTNLAGSLVQALDPLDNEALLKTPCGQSHVRLLAESLYEYMQDVEQAVQPFDS